MNSCSFLGLGELRRLGSRLRRLQIAFAALAAFVPLAGHAASILDYTEADQLGLDSPSKTFLYALTTASAADGLTVGNATFEYDPLSGGLILGAFDVDPWGTPTISGSTNPTDDANLTRVTESIRVGPLSVTLTGLTVGATYELQLLFHERDTFDRQFDVLLDGTSIVPAGFTSGQGVNRAVIEVFEAGSSSVVITMPNGPNQATLNALTLAIPEPSGPVLIFGLLIGALVFRKQRRG
ncbi:MAG: PEP-CTERM sorting domain-containing protein [Verrucomicrobiae bacterium]|nr:PEP-CTERM sorting domain-containing protein [Verrucomicrobiae bacterium]